jgi:hypothetical protein
LVSATIDHIISITIFIAALLLFVNLFSQTNQTAIAYQEHRAIATKCSDLLDNMLLNPGSPSNWGQSNSAPTAFGLQDPEFTQYQLSPFSVMRLEPATGDTIEYGKTTQSLYSSITAGFGNSLLMPQAETLTYPLALKLLGVNNTYGFQLTLTPVLAVSIGEEQTANLLNLSLNVTGTGFPLANATINYVLIKVSLPQAEADYPFYTLQSGAVYADEEGYASVAFNLDDETQNYAFVAYAHVGGLVGVGFHERVSATDEYVVPMVEDMATQTVLLAHNYDLNASGPAGATLKYNATFVLLSEDYTLRELPLGNPGVPSLVGAITSGAGNPYAELTLPYSNSGILIVTYQKSTGEGGVVVMPWGISSLAFPVTFGGDPQDQEWVATDMRLVTINHVTYQAKLAVWQYSTNLVTG